MLAIYLDIEADVAQRAGALLVLLAGDAHQPHSIAQVVLQGASDAAAQIGLSRLAGLAARQRAQQSLAGRLDQIIPLHQRKQAPGHDGGDGNRSAEVFRYSQRQVLQHRGIARSKGCSRQGRGLRLAARRGSKGSHRRDGTEPHPQRLAGSPRQVRPAEAEPQGAPGLILAMA